jgi:hypothetical protein
VCSSGLFPATMRKRMRTFSGRNYAQGLISSDTPLNLIWKNLPPRIFYILFDVFFSLSFFTARSKSFPINLTMWFLLYLLPFSLCQPHYPLNMQQERWLLLCDMSIGCEMFIAIFRPVWLSFCVDDSMKLTHSPVGFN